MDDQATIALEVAQELAMLASVIDGGVSRVNDAGAPDVADALATARDVLGALAFTLAHMGDGANGNPNN